MKILVIKLGALGDVVLAFRAFAAIRAHHPQAQVTLLTTAPYRALAQASPWFDRVVLDRRPAWWNLPGLWRLVAALRGYDFVYDLQTSRRSGHYFRLAGRPPWSGNVPGASHAQRGPARERMHTIERQRDQLRIAGISHFPAPDLSWLRRGGPALPPNAAVLVPGTSASRPAKRWPADRHAELAVHLAGSGLAPIVVGTTAERTMAAAILSACPAAIDLTGRTSLLELAGLLAQATVAIGGDTGPMHLAAAVGCRCVALFSAASDPALAAPRGDVVLLREPNLADLAVARVAAAALDRHQCRSTSETA